MLFLALLTKFGICFNEFSSFSRKNSWQLADSSVMNKHTVNNQIKMLLKAIKSFLDIFLNKKQICSDYGSTKATLLKV